MKKSLRKITNAPAVTILVILAIMVVVFRVMGFSLVYIDSGSMTPVMPEGSIAVVQPTKDIKPTDIISFQQNGMPQRITHTFIGYADDGSLRTKGDANLAPDNHDAQPLQMSDVKGKVVVTFPILSAFFWTSVRGVLSIVYLALVAFATVLILRNNKKKGLPTDQPVSSLTPNPV